MFRDLAELGRDLEAQGKLTPFGYYNYREPIRWVVHLWPSKVYVEASEIDRARPFDGRTSAIRAHPLVDEGGYALGVSRLRGGNDRHAGRKHATFRALIEKVLRSPLVRDATLKEAVTWLYRALDAGLIGADSRYGQILSKDWVSFVPEVGSLSGQHLFEHREVKAFWETELAERTVAGSARTPPMGECAVCGVVRPLVRKIPKVKLASTVPLHGLNADAFVSFIGGPEPSRKAHLGMCLPCGDLTARAFNVLSSSKYHRKDLVRDQKKRDSLANQIALFWLKSPAPLQAAERAPTEEEWLAAFTAPLDVGFGVRAPEADEQHVANLLDVPWKPKDASLMLDDYAFYFVLLSPNVGRIAVREWFSVSLAELRGRLSRFLGALRLVGFYGDEPRARSIAGILGALDTRDPNITRGLLRTAYLGYAPPAALLGLAVSRAGTLWMKGRQDRPSDERERVRDIEALTSAIKLVLFYGKETDPMDQLNTAHKAAPYLCGRLLSVLERAQQISHWVRSRQELNRTIVDRFYGSASTAPCSVFGNLVRLGTTAHLPDAGEINILMEDVMRDLDEAGGFPSTLTSAEQAEFHLGFYHQRADFRTRRKKEQPAGEMPEEVNE